MVNIVLFIASVFAYFGIWYGIDMPDSTTEHVVRVGILVVLCMPFNIRGNVFTVIGNAVSERNIFSLFSLYQKAGHVAFTIFGLAGYQNAGDDALFGFGFAGYQKAGHDAFVAFGLAGYQRAVNDATVALGIAGYQKAGRNAKTPVGIAIYQRIDSDKGRAFSAFS